VYARGAWYPHTESEHLMKPFALALGVFAASCEPTLGIEDALKDL
jgi:hypothetical protein